MTLIPRAVLAVCLAGGFLFCAFGFLATFEPGDRYVMMTFRLIYAVAGTATIMGQVALWRRTSNKKS